MIALIDIVYAMAATVALIGVAEQERLDRLVDASRQIQPGDTEAEVHQILGRPTDKWDRSGFFQGGPPQWVYGTIVDLDYIVYDGFVLPFPLSVKLRIFGAYESDLVINWDADGTVESVARPSLKTGG